MPVEKYFDDYKKNSKNVNWRGKKKEDHEAQLKALVSFKKVLEFNPVAKSSVKEVDEKIKKLRKKLDNYKKPRKIDKAATRKFYGT